jgi:hypothetical protein
VALPARRRLRARSTARAVALAVVAVLALLGGTDFPALAQDRVTTWSALLTPDRDDTNVRSDAGGLRLTSTPTVPASIGSGRPQGMLLTAVHPLAELSSQVATELVADQPPGSAVAVDIRGIRGDGSWTEWLTTGPKTPTGLGAAVTAVQTRIMLHSGEGGASPLVRSVRLTAQPGIQLLAARPRNAPSYRVFATREGLVGGTTANGHVIKPRDHFVALPSARGLGPRDSGDYTVKICASSGRCEWAPVWDVGPWNTTDDYWNTPDGRQAWQDLPRGQPEAQAAHDDGYNGGRDQFNRQVVNSAGIDLADGTFWDGLGLRSNSWVTVTYLWTGDGTPAIVALPILPVFSGPGEQYPAVGLAAQRAKLLVECTTTGSAGPADRWLRIGPKQFISATHVTIAGKQASGTRCATP